MVDNAGEPGHIGTRGRGALALVVVGNVDLQAVTERNPWATAAKLMRANSRCPHIEGNGRATMATRGEHGPPIHETETTALMSGRGGDVEHR